MRLAFASTAAVLFGTGAYLLLQRDLVRVVLGVMVVSQCAVLTLIAAGLTRGDAPIYPLHGRRVSDPLSQAMALTAIVIGLAVISLLLVQVYRVVVAYQTDELDDLDAMEAESDARRERERAREQEAEEAAAR